MVQPNPTAYSDFGSESNNSVLTPGSPGQLIGHRLKLDPADLRQGVFFVAGDGSAVQVAMVMRNKPADLMFMVPDGLAAGEHSLEVRTAPTAESDLRTGRLRHTLIVI